MTLSRRLIPFCFILCCITGCDLSVVTSDPSAMPYQTGHFRIFYNPADFSGSEIEEIGLLKERMLVHVNEYLGQTFQQTITAIIADTITNSHMDWYGLQTHEQTAYARNDNGHEIAHVVSMYCWGTSKMHFLVEGVAVASQYQSSGDAIDTYTAQFKKNTNRSVELDSSINHLGLDITNDEFAYTYHAYCRAGAFIHYLRTTYGLKSVQAWWALAATDPATIEPQLFFSAMGKPLTEVIADFARVVKSRFHA